MITTKVEAVPHPMVYVTGRTTMESADISAFIGKAFETLQTFSDRAGLKPTGAPLAVYKDWNGKTMCVELGFPVTATDLAKATGDVLAGRSPAGSAVRAMHEGSYATLRDTYRAMETEMQSRGQRGSGVTWEIYHKGPGMVPETAYETEIFMQLVQNASGAARAEVSAAGRRN